MVQEATETAKRLDLREETPPALLLTGTPADSLAVWWANDLLCAILENESVRVRLGFRALATQRLTDRRIRGTNKPPLLRPVTVRHTRAIDLKFLPTLDVSLHKALPLPYGWRARACL